MTLYVSKCRFLELFSELFVHLELFHPPGNLPAKQVVF